MVDINYVRCLTPDRHKGSAILNLPEVACSKYSYTPLPVDYKVLGKGPQRLEGLGFVIVAAPVVSSADSPHLRRMVIDLSTFGKELKLTDNEVLKQGRIWLKINFKIKGKIYYSHMKQFLIPQRTQAMRMPLRSIQVSFKCSIFLILGYDLFFIATELE